MQIPRRVTRFNRVVVNPIQGLYAWLIPPWAVIRHRGRRSGRPYRTPVLAFTRGGMVAVVVLYGEQSDWVQNLLAGSGHITRAGRTHKLVAPRLVSLQDAPDATPLSARALARTSGLLLIAEIAE